MNKLAEIVQWMILGGMLGHIMEVAGITLFSLHWFIILFGVLFVWTLLDVIKDWDKFK